MPFRKANFIISKGGIGRKIFKVILDNNGDLYFTFNYCQTTKYYSGNAVIKAGETDLIFNPTIEGASSEIPLKLSYHKDGQMHFKALENTASQLPKSYKLAEMKTTPFNELKGEHFLTIEVEGLNHFETFKLKKKNEFNRVFEVDNNSVRYKFILAGNVNPEEVIKKHYPIDILEIVNQSHPNPIYFGIQLQGFNTSIKQNAKKDDLMLVIICGFKIEDNTPNKDMEFIYLQAR